MLTTRSKQWEHPFYLELIVTFALLFFVSKASGNRFQTFSPIGLSLTIVSYSKTESSLSKISSVSWNLTGTSIHVRLAVSMKPVLVDVFCWRGLFIDKFTLIRLISQNGFFLVPKMHIQEQSKLPEVTSGFRFAFLRHTVHRRIPWLRWIAPDTALSKLQWPLTRRVVLIVQNQCDGRTIHKCEVVGWVADHCLALWQNIWVRFDSKNRIPFQWFISNGKATTLWD
jgi:hypothetical protein